MTNFVILSKTHFSHEEFKEFVLSSDGDKWYEDKPSHGAISKDESAIYIDYSDTGFDDYYFDESDEYDMKELNRLIDELGGNAKTSISIHVGHGKGSGKLALGFADKLIEKWGGIIDWKGSGTSRELLELR